MPVTPFRRWMPATTRPLPPTTTTRQVSMAPSPRITGATTARVTTAPGALRRIATPPGTAAAGAATADTTATTGIKVTWVTTTAERRLDAGGQAGLVPAFF